MYCIKLDTMQCAYDLALRLDRYSPFGVEFSDNAFWELFDDGFLLPELRSHKTNGLYDAYSELLPTDIVDSIFIPVFEAINALLDYRIDSRYRHVLPDTVYYEGCGIYKVYWSVSDVWNDDDRWIGTHRDTGDTCGVFRTHGV